MDTCEHHEDMAERLATECEARRWLECQVGDLHISMRTLDTRMRELERTVHRWGGAIAVLAALPLILQILRALVPAALAGWAP